MFGRFNPNTQLFGCYRISVIIQEISPQRVMSRTRDLSQVRATYKLFFEIPHSCSTSQTTLNNEFGVVRK